MSKNCKFQAGEINDSNTELNELSLSLLSTNLYKIQCKW